MLNARTSAICKEPVQTTDLCGRRRGDGTRWNAQKFSQIKQDATISAEERKRSALSTVGGRTVPYRRKQENIACYWLAQVERSALWEVLDGIPARARFSAPVRTVPGAHSASYAMGTGLFSGAKRPGCVVNHPPASSAGVKERVDLYFSSHFGSSRPGLGRSLPLLFCFVRLET